MSKMFYKIVMLVLLLAASACQSSYNVIQITPEKIPLNHPGIFYALPRTFVNIELTVTKTEYTKGPYAEFAEKYLGIKGIETQNSTRYEITDVNFKTYNEPDPEHYYFIEFDNKKGFEKNQLLTLTLSESGLIQSVNENAEKIVSDNVIFTSNENYIDKSKTFFFSGSNVYEKVDTIIEHVTVDTLVIEKQTLKRTMV